MAYVNKNREGREFWNRLCSLPRYMFLLRPSGKGVQKLEDSTGNWIDVHDAQQIVDDAQTELAALREELANERRVNTYVDGRSYKDVAETLATKLTAAEQEADQFRESSAQIASDLLAAEPSNKCGRCGASTVDGCNYLGCHFLESGNGAPVVEHQPDAVRTLDEIEKSIEARQKRIEAYASPPTPVAVGLPTVTPFNVAEVEKQAYPIMAWLVRDLPFDTPEQEKTRSKVCDLIHWLKGSLDAIRSRDACIDKVKELNQ